MLLLGIDLGTSSIKVAVVDAASQACLASVQYPDAETPVTVRKPGWAEQAPAAWWDHVCQAILRAHATGTYNPRDIGAIGIAYQMHGLVLVDRDQQVLRDAIIWCDSRAVEIGERAFRAIGPEKCLSHLLNSPGNFTAAKLAWVREHEPSVYSRTSRVLLPGDFLAMKLTGEMTTSISALSEGIFWDFRANRISRELLNYFGFDESLIPPVRPVFSEHGRLAAPVAAALSLAPGIPVTYKAGDQPNNALSLGVLEPGQVAATAGTSGVVYAVSDQLTSDPRSRINSFAHVNHSEEATRLGVLLCINGTGILNRWMRDLLAPGESYDAINRQAAGRPPGARGLRILPFGNGAERMLENRLAGASVLHADFNQHTRGDLLRAAQEGIAFAFRYGLDILRENGMHPRLIRAGKANLFLSPLFREVFTQVTGCQLELYNTDGAVGAARGAGLGIGYYRQFHEAFAGMEKLLEESPREALQREYEPVYQSWLEDLHHQLARS
ncbi:MAG TPA: FGGY family carbohydrate kinase [Chitinophagaceae bacterium]|nr:FGGY family carbohydrate kinase [Chitinophagaceae bacterium]